MMIQKDTVDTSDQLKTFNVRHQHYLLQSLQVEEEEEKENVLQQTEYQSLLREEENAPSGGCKRMENSLKHVVFAAT